jgi:hypothetical protein
MDTQPTNVYTPDAPTGSPNGSAEPTPLPQKRDRRLRQGLVIGATVIAVGVISFLSFALASTSHTEGQYHTQLGHANATIKAQDKTIDTTTNNLNQALSTISTDKADINNANSQISTDNSQISNDKKAIGQLTTENNQDQATIENLQSQLDVQNEVPPGGYSAFQSSLISALSSEQNVSGSSVDCVLPSTWTPGTDFSCDVFDSNNTYLGYADITIDSDNPDGSPAWTYEWYSGSNNSY